jgi:beta-galactosidase
MHRLPLTHLAAAALSLLAICWPATAQDAPPYVDPARSASDHRAHQGLAGSWAFMPAPAADQPPAAPDEAGNTWGRVAVPGSWKSFGYPPVTSGLEAGGLGTAWNQFSGGHDDATPHGWYRREVTVPADWAGRTVRLGFERLGTRAEVWLDGRHAGSVEWPGGELDVTDDVTPGEPQQLLIRVDVVLPGEELVQDMLLSAYADRMDVAHAAGLLGEVWLRSLPPDQPVVDDVFVHTRVGGGRVGLEVDLESLDRPTPVRVTARMLGHAGQVEREFTGEAQADPGQTPMLSLNWPWEDARLWDLDRPELYTLDLQVAAADDAWSDRVQQRFGFREYVIDGRNLLLNGVPIRLRPMVTSMTLAGDEARSHLRRLRDAGFTQAMPWPQKAQPGMLGFSRDIVLTADEMGLPSTGVVQDMRGFIGAAGERWDRPGNVEAFRELADQQIRKLRNHPSILTWVTTPNFLGHAQDQNPLLVGRHEGGPSRQVWEQRQPAAAQGVELLRALDPTRPVMLHNGSYVGDIYSVNLYLNLLPLEERRRWFTHYAQAGEMPFVAVETGLPLFTTMLRGRAGYLNATRTEPLVTEQIARYLGPAAYEGETPELRRLIADQHRDGDRWASFHNHPIFREHEPLAGLVSRFIRETNAAWRLTGLSGGALPWDIDRMIRYPDRPIAPAARTYMRHNRDTLAFIAGGPDDPLDLTPRYTAGQTLHKQAALVNDTREPQSVSGRWSVRVDGQQVAEGDLIGEVAPGSHLLLPIDAQLPDAPAEGKLDGHVTLDARIGDEPHEERFAFRVFAASPEPAVASVAVIDPAGLTSDALRAVGIEPRAWDPDDDPSLVVLGREAVGELPGQRLAELERHVRDGGTLVVMAQPRGFYEHTLDLRTSEYIARRMFPLPHDVAITGGLDAADLEQFTGQSTLLPPHRDFDYDWRTQRFEGNAHYPAYGWRWGGHHGVSSIPLEVPHRSGFTPLMVGGFDLAYSPLMVGRLGAGKLVLCTLALEDHAAVDPVARLLLQRVMSPASYDGVAERPAARTVYVGGDAGRQLLRLIGVEHEPIEAADVARLDGDTLLITDGDGPDADGLTSLLRAGGRAVVLPLDASTLDASVQPGTFATPAPEVPAWPEALGLTVADLHSRIDLDLPLLQDGELDVAADGLLGRQTIGDGAAVFVQADPMSLDTETRPYLRYTAWRQSRLLSQLLANQGATFEFDRTLRLAGRDASELPMSLGGPWHARLIQRLDPSPSPAQRHEDPGTSRGAQQALQQAHRGIAQAGGPWQAVQAPGEWEDYGQRWETADGEAVFARTVTIPEPWRGQVLQLQLGRIDDIDATYVNGELVGRTDGWDRERVYQIPPRLTRDGTLHLAIRVFDNFGGGGFSSPPGTIHLAPRTLPEQRRGYHPDYRDTHGMGDHPDRYYRW